MKEKFLQRYKDAVMAYFNYPGSGEGHREKLYIADEYEKIMIEEFEMTHEELRQIYHELYWSVYGGKQYEKD